MELRKLLPLRSSKWAAFLRCVPPKVEKFSPLDLKWILVDRDCCVVVITLGAVRTVTYFDYAG